MAKRKSRKATRTEGDSKVHSYSLKPILNALEPPERERKVADKAFRGIEAWAERVVRDESADQSDRENAGDILVCLYRMQIAIEDDDAVIASWYAIRVGAHMTNQTSGKLLQTTSRQKAGAREVNSMKAEWRFRQVRKLVAEMPYNKSARTTAKNLIKSHGTKYGKQTTIERYVRRMRRDAQS